MENPPHPGPLPPPLRGGGEGVIGASERDSEICGLTHYYAQRAAEYERIYEKMERQADLNVLRDRVRAFAAGRHLLEIACGTGYWTAIAAENAASILGFDVNEPVLELARSKKLDSNRVEFLTGDAYAPPGAACSCDAAFAGFWWSHIPLGRIDEFIAGLIRALPASSPVMLFDNRLVPGSSTPLSRTDVEGNTYQLRRLENGTNFEVLKNFPTEESLRESLGRNGCSMEFEELQYYWIATVTLPSGR